MVDPVVEHAEEGEETIRMASDRNGELTEVTQENDHINGTTTDGEVGFTFLFSAGVVTFRILGAGTGVVVAIGADLADTDTPFPLAFIREPTTSSRVVTTSELTLGLGTARGRLREIPSAASVFSTENFVGELDAVVFFTVSSIPSTLRGIDVAVVGFVPTAETFAA